MARLTETVIVRHPDTDEPVALAAGSGLPEWAAGLVGEHALEDDAPKARRAKSGGDKK